MQCQLQKPASLDPARAPRWSLWESFSDLWSLGQGLATEHMVIFFIFKENICVLCVAFIMHM